MTTPPSWPTPVSAHAPFLAAGVDAATLQCAPFPPPASGSAAAAARVVGAAVEAALRSLASLGERLHHGPSHYALLPRGRLLPPAPVAAAAGLVVAAVLGAACARAHTGGGAGAGGGHVRPRQWAAAARACAPAWAAAAASGAALWALCAAWPAAPGGGASARAPPPAGALALWAAVSAAALRRAARPVPDARPAAVAALCCSVAGVALTHSLVASPAVALPAALVFAPAALAAQPRQAKPGHATFSGGRFEARRCARWAAVVASSPGGALALACAAAGSPPAALLRRLGSGRADALLAPLLFLALVPAWALLAGGVQAARDDGSALD